MGAVVFVQDVSAEHVARQEQGDVHDRLVVTLNREFRTPLTKLVGYAEILHDMSVDLPPEADRFLTKIREAADELTRLVDSVTDPADLHRSNLHGAARECVAPTGHPVADSPRGP